MLIESLFKSFILAIILDSFFTQLSYEMFYLLFSFLLLLSTHSWFQPGLDPHIRSTSATPVGFSHKSLGPSVVLISGQLNKWLLSWGLRPHRGQDGDGWFTGSILFIYSSNSGDLLVQSCANTLLVCLGNSCSDEWIGSACSCSTLFSSILPV